ncbi:MAG TPA: MBL fold metallo-hydrolase, partial [Cytophagaceae bacterium]
MLIILVAAASLSLVGCLVLQQKTFGSKPKGKRLDRVKASPQFKNGTFENFSPTPMMAKDASYFKLIKKYIWKENKTEPDYILPSVKRNLKLAPSGKPTITWFGHSTLLVQIEGKNILIDPVFSERASPFSFVGSKSYPGTRVYGPSDLPAIDYLLLSHDHYDHLDYETIMQMKDNVKRFVTPIGVGAHLEYWKVPEQNISELDWWDVIDISPEIKITAVPARHFSGRGLLDRNKTLWCSYVLQTKDYKIYIGGDSGYDTHFKAIGDKFGPFDLAFIECGQYNAFWPYIHMS